MGETSKVTMSSLLPLAFEQNAVRVSIADDGTHTFVAKDVCDVLGIVNSRECYR